MTKAELLKYLDPFDDSIELLIVVDKFAFRIDRLRYSCLGNDADTIVFVLGGAPSTAASRHGVSSL